MVRKLAVNRPWHAVLFMKRDGTVLMNDSPLQSRAASRMWSYKLNRSHSYICALFRNQGESTAQSIPHTCIPPEDTKVMQTEESHDI